MVVEFVMIYRALPIPHNLDYYEFLKHKESSALVGMRFTHGINDKTLPRVFLNGFDVGFYQRSHLGLQRSDAPFANIAWVNIKQNSFIGIKRPVVKTADFENVKGVSGKKSYGTFTAFNPTTEEDQKMSYEIVVCAQAGGAQEFFLIYKEDDEHAKQIIEKIQNSIELRKAKQ